MLMSWQGRLFSRRVASHNLLKVWDAVPQLKRPLEWWGGKAAIREVLGLVEEEESRCGLEGVWYSTVKRFAPCEGRVRPALHASAHLGAEVEGDVAMFWREDSKRAVQVVH